MHITKNTFLPRIIEVQALSEIISNYSAFGINQNVLSVFLCVCGPKGSQKKIPLEINVSCGIFFFSVLFYPPIIFFNIYFILSVSATCPYI